MKLAVIGALLCACQSNNPALEAKLDNLATQLAATQHTLADIQQHMPPESLEHKIDDIEKRLDTIAAMVNRVPPSRPRRIEPDPAKVYAVGVDGNPVDGPRDALVTMVLAYDYADPYTDKSRDGRVELRKKYGNDLRIVYRNFVVHPTVATAGALAGCAADKQGKFTAYDDVLWEKGFKGRQFDDDKCWANAAGCPVALGYAKQLHLDVPRFKRDMAACEPALRAGMAELQRFGVGATPSFFINGRYMAGAMPIETFEALIDEELAKAKDRVAAGSSRASYFNDWVLGKGLKQLEP